MALPSRPRPALAGVCSTGDVLVTTNPLTSQVARIRRGEAGLTNGRVIQGPRPARRGRTAVSGGPCGVLAWHWGLLQRRHRGLRGPRSASPREHRAVVLNALKLERFHRLPFSFIGRAAVFPANRPEPTPRTSPRLSCKVRDGPALAAEDAGRSEAWTSDHGRLDTARFCPAGGGPMAPWKAGRPPAGRREGRGRGGRRDGPPEPEAARR